MATGVPKSIRARNENPSEQRTDSGPSATLRLCYEGKRAEQDILDTPPARIVPLQEPMAAGISAPPAENRLYFGDNLPILSALTKEPSVRGKVRLIYIDPPYATGHAFQSRSQEDAYEDILVGAHYVEFLRERLVFLRELLADDGSIYVHLDKNIAFSIKIIMDELFGSKNFRSWITRKKCNPKNYTSRTYGNVADYILFYTRSDNYVWHRAVEEWTQERAAKEYQCIDKQGRRYKKVPVHAPGVRNGQTGQPWNGVLPPPGKHWQYTPETLDAMDARGEIYWSPNGNPRRKVYLDNSAGVPVQDIWLEFRDAHNQNVKVTGYPTEKNPDLLTRIIQASSNPGDLILDSFSGSGTTLAVAAQWGRRWIGIDNSPQAIETTLQRFAHGLNPMGDFVRKSSEQEETQMELFSNPPGEDRKLAPVVTDFTLYADSAVAQSLPQSDLTAAGAVKG